MANPTETDRLRRKAENRWPRLIVGFIAAVAVVAFLNEVLDLGLKISPIWSGSGTESKVPPAAPGSGHQEGNAAAPSTPPAPGSGQPDDCRYVFMDLRVPDMKQVMVHLGRGAETWTVRDGFDGVKAIAVVRNIYQQDKVELSVSATLAANSPPTRSKILDLKANKYYHVGTLAGLKTEDSLTATAVDETAYKTWLNSDPKTEVKPCPSYDDNEVHLDARPARYPPPKDISQEKGPADWRLGRAREYGLAPQFSRIPHAVRHDRFAQVGHAGSTSARRLWCCAPRP